jgi:uncharacterized membrane protein
LSSGKLRGFCTGLIRIVQVWVCFLFGYVLQGRKEHEQEEESMAKRVQESIEVEAPLQDVFLYWSNFQNFPKIMRNVEEVRATGPDTSRWRVKGPVGKTVEYEAKTTEMSPTRGIAWESIEGEVENSGRVRFEEVAPGRTRIEVTMTYGDPPGGKVGEVVADAIYNPERELREDLENFAKQVERGELRLGGPTSS